MPSQYRMCFGTPAIIARGWGSFIVVKVTENSLMSYFQSKHRTPPFQGKLRFSKDSGLRKLMRAARRGKIPDERLVIVKQAENVALGRRNPTEQPGAGSLGTTNQVS